MLNDPRELADVVAVVEDVDDPDDVDAVEDGEEVALELLPYAVPTSATPTSTGRENLRRGFVALDLGDSVLTAATFNSRSAARFGRQPPPSHPVHASAIPTTSTIPVPPSDPAKVVLPKLNTPPSRATNW